MGLEEAASAGVGRLKDWVLGTRRPSCPPVTNNMAIAREEIFGPVLSIIGYTDDADAIRIANDTPYGLAGYVQSADIERARSVARQIRAGNIHLNGAAFDQAAPFGGYKQSGNGREFGEWGLREFLETKAILGYNAA